MAQPTDDKELAYQINTKPIYTNRFEAMTIKEAEHILTDEFEDETTTTIPFRRKGMYIIIY